MYPELKTRLMNSLKAEADYINKAETDKKQKLKKLNDIINVVKVIDNYEEIEPKIADAINELAKNRKFNKEER